MRKWSRYLPSKIGCFLFIIDVEIKNARNRPDGLMEKDIPRLRADIDIIPTRYQGKKALLVKDSLGLIKDPVILQGTALQVIALIDGRNDVRDIQLELMRLRGGMLVSKNDVEDMLSEFDAAFLIDSSNYRRERDKIAEDYSRLKVRNAFLAGTAYPREPEKLKAYIQSVLKLEEGVSHGLEGRRILALIAPHIDLEVGKKVYAKAYRILKDSSPKKVLLLGTGHNLQESYLSLTEKDFATPLGLTRTDREWVKRLKEAGSEVVSPDDFYHRSEHSLEFQLLFLQHLFGFEFSLLPVLCGSFQSVLSDVSRPAEIQGMSAFLSTLMKYAEDDPSHTLTVAGVDFSHIGPKFGHRQAASSLLLEAKEYDRLLIQAISQSDVVNFWAEAKKVNNRYNACGFSALAILMELLSGRKGHVLGYDFWMEEATQSAVSFAALAFPEEYEK